MDPTGAEEDTPHARDRQLLSVVVTLTGDDSDASRCMQALAAQRGAPPTEIVVPLYSKLHDSASLRLAWPEVRFIDMLEDPPPPGPAWEHWKVDRLRAVGLQAARGDIVGMLQDNGLPDDRWSATVWELHRQHTHEAIGGSVRHAGASLLNRAAYYCDFLRYQAPFLPAITDYASVINVSYKREAIEECRDAWQEFFDESVVHRRIRNRGRGLYLTSMLSVDYDYGALPFAVALRRKVASGRAFAARRSRTASVLRRVAYASLSPGLAPLLLVRQFILLRRRGQEVRPFLAAVPFISACLVGWSLGELIGYATAQPFPASRNSRP